MKTQSINNHFSFGAKIKISKPDIEAIRDAGLLSGTGTTFSAIGASSFAPLSDPTHHINTIGKTIDSSSAITGTGIAAYGLKYIKQAAKLIFKNKKS